MGLVVVTNSGERRIYLESQVLDWSQDGSGAEHVVESETALASPPAMWVPPRSSYTMRIRLPPGSADVERAFRVMIKQLPERSEVVGGRVVFALTQNLPAFVVPPNPSAPVLTARIMDPRRVLIQNAGGRRARLTKITQDGHVLASGLIGYALARGGLAVPLVSPIHAGTLDVETDVGHRDISVR